MKIRHIIMRGIALLLSAMMTLPVTGCDITDLPLIGTDAPTIKGKGDSEGQEIDVSRLFGIPGTGSQDNSDNNGNNDNNGNSDNNGYSDNNDYQGSDSGFDSNNNDSNNNDSNGDQTIASNPFENNPFGSFDRGEDNNNNDSSSQGFPESNNDYGNNDNGYGGSDDYTTSSGSDSRLGYIQGSTYKNDFFGLKLTSPVGYEFTDDGVYTDAEYASRELDDGEAVIVACGADSTDLNFFDVVVQSYANMNDSLFNEEDILKIAKVSLERQLTDGGAEVISMDISQKIVAGEIHYVLSVHGSYQGYDFYEQMVNIQKDDYMFSVVVNNFITDKTDDVLNNIEKMY